MKPIRIQYSNILTAFDESTIGSKVTNENLFLGRLARSIANTDFEAQRVPGQAFIPLVTEDDDSVLQAVSAGVGKHTQNPSDYVVREYRGKVKLFLHRSHAEPVENVAAVVYTRDAYLSDPDVQASDEAQRIQDSDCTHVLVAVIASAGPQNSPLSPGRLVHNLAGGNKEALEWTADEIRAKAAESLEYYSEWGTVADPSQ